MTEDRKQRVIEKIRKLMSKADPTRGATKEEAAIFAAKAAELLETYKLSMTDIEFREMQLNDPIKEWYVDHEDLDLKAKKTRQGWSERLAIAVARAHSCEILIHFKSNNFTLIGREQDAEVATYMYHYLYSVCETTSRRAYGAYYRRCAAQGDVTLARGFRSSYQEGFVSEVAERYRQRREAAERERNGQGTALVRINDERKAVEDYLSSMKESGRVKVKKTRSLSKNVRNGEGLRRGREAGNKVSLDNSGIKAPKKSAGRIA